MKGAISAGDRNKVNLLMKELQNIEDAITLLRTIAQAGGSVVSGVATVDELKQRRTQIRHTLQELSC